MIPSMDYADDEAIQPPLRAVVEQPRTADALIAICERMALQLASLQLAMACNPAGAIEKSKATAAEAFEVLGRVRREQAAGVAS